jgi:hypothetical protein
MRPGTRAGGETPPRWPSTCNPSGTGWCLVAGAQANSERGRYWAGSSRRYRRCGMEAAGPVPERQDCALVAAQIAPRSACGSPPQPAPRLTQHQQQRVETGPSLSTAPTSIRSSAGSPKQPSRAQATTTWLVEAPSKAKGAAKALLYAAFGASACNAQSALLQSRLSFAGAPAVLDDPFLILSGFAWRFSVLTQQHQRGFAHTAR